MTTLRFSYPKDGVKDLTVISGPCNIPTTVRKVSSRGDWFQAFRVIEGKYFGAFGNSAKVAAILLNKEIAKEKIARQGSFNF